MVGIYFSGTGNSKYAAELFCKEYDKESGAYSIEDTEALAAVADADLIVFAIRFSLVQFRKSCGIIFQIIVNCGRTRRFS